MLAQRTIRNKTSATGVGLHTGVKATLTLHPADPDTGILFRKIEGNNVIEIPAQANFVGDTTLSTTGSSKDLLVNANGKSVTLTSSTATQDIIINKVYNADITAASAVRNVAITGNGDVTLRDLSALKGNIDVSNVGSINVISATNATGTLNLTNERAPLGTDITITDANSTVKVTIKSAGSITATSNNGLASAQIINLTAAGESTIYSDGVSNQDITVNSVNSLGKSTNFKN